MKKFLFLLFCLFFCFSSISVFADELGITESSNDTVILENTEESTVLSNTDDSTVLDNTDNTDILTNINNNLKYLIDLINCLLLFIIFIVVYRTLYKLFCFVI